MGPASEYLDETNQNTAIYYAMRRYLTAYHYLYLPVVTTP
jgi:hypothetical protein